jgi:uncharacterized protein YcbX
MTALGQVRKLWRYPVSSLAGEPLQTISLGREGAAGDRLYGLVDVASGEVAAPDRNAKWHPVPRIRTRLSDDGRLEIAVPGGDWLAAPGPECDRELTAFLGFEAAIRPFAGEGPPGYDGPLTAARYKKAPVHLLTTASLARLKALHPAANPDPRRFRPSILVDMPEIEGAFPESGWLGRRIAIGEVELTVSEPCRRCGFTIIAQDGFDTDPDILRTLVRHNAHNIGVYCSVDRPGDLELNAPLRFL